MIPTFICLRPPGHEEHDKRRGRAVAAAEVLGALQIEKMKADNLPFDAVADAEFHRPDGV